FEYATNAAFTNSTVVGAQSLPAGNVAQPVSVNLVNLSFGATYYFRVRASNSTGTTTGGSQSFTTTSCSYSINPTSQNFSAAGGTGMVTVTATSGCGWTVVNNLPWVTINSGGSGAGNGVVNYTVVSNTGAARMGIITIAGQTFTVNQDGVCSFSISPTSQNFTAA